MMNIIQRSTEYYTASGVKNPPLGLVLHNTVTANLVPPHSQGSWHYELDRDGQIYQYVRDFDYAWHVRACDEWRPGWMRRRDNRVSEANSCTIGIEMVSWMGVGAALPAGYIPYTDAQYVSLKQWFLLMYDRYGTLPIVTHGSLQLDRTDPVGFDTARAGLLWISGFGYVMEEIPVEAFDLEAYANEQMILRADEIYAYLSQFHAMNDVTAIYKRAARSYVLGETRGPCISDEYPGKEEGHVRQNFTAGTADYSPDGTVNWVELNIE